MSFNDIGAKIKQARKSAGLSQGGLSKKSGVAQSTLSYIEKGAKSPTMDTMVAICNGLSISLLDLLIIGESNEDKNNKVKASELNKNSNLTDSLEKEFSNFKDYIIDKYGE
jgi:transcriptional regulator with XRE-family HTH domain